MPERILVTGGAGFVGSNLALRFKRNRSTAKVVVLDNLKRRGSELALERLRRRWRQTAIQKIFSQFGHDIAVVIHTAAQPSHDWAARDPVTDFTVNANGTLTLLEATRHHCPEAPFIFCSTNKVYGDTPNRLPLVEQDSRWEVAPQHPFARHGVDETMTIDASTHSLFGVSKAAADLMVQEFGRYFGLQTACFRGGCLTGPGHSGTQLHGFLSYLMRCAVSGQPYRVLGYKGKQVRDNIHSFDLVNAFWHFFKNPRKGEVYNIGGGRYANCSMLEAIALCEELTGRSVNWSYIDGNRAGDHIWWISDMGRFQSHYPEWRLSYDIRTTLAEIHDVMRCRVGPSKRQADAAADID